jgi:hypothetical protein
VGRESGRRSARLRESDGDERSRARFDRNERGVAGIADLRRNRFSRVVDENEPIEDFVAVGLLVVLDPHDAGRVEVQLGQPPLREHEVHQTAQQGRETHPVAAATG